MAASVTNDAGDSDFHVRAYSAASGAVLWTDTYDPTAGFESAGSILFDGGTVFVGGSGTRPRRLDKHILRAYDADSGALIWESRQQSQTEGQGIVGLAAGRGHVCSVGSGIRKRNLDYLVRCHRSRDGDLRWEDRFDLERNSDRALVIARSRGRIVTAGVGTREPPVRNGNLLVRTYEIR